MQSILFVCTGNICRSPTADGIFRQLVLDRKLNITVDSAGTHGYHIGDAPDRRTMQTAKARGIDLSPLRARKLVREDFDQFDLLLAMDNGHLGMMQAMASTPAHQEKIALFLDILDTRQGQDVPDPYYGGAQGFEDVYDLVYAGCEAWLERFSAAG